MAVTAQIGEEAVTVCLLAADTDTRDTSCVTASAGDVASTRYAPIKHAVSEIRMF